MTNFNKTLLQTINPSCQTRDLGKIAAKSGNIYRSISVVSKRAKQLGVQIKEELHGKLEEFASTTDNLEEVFENREQIEISRFYEKLPHPTILAMEEFWKIRSTTVIETRNRFCYSLIGLPQGIAAYA